MCVKGNPKKCPHNHVHLFLFVQKLDTIEETDLKDSLVETETESFQNENIFSCSEQETDSTWGVILVVLKLNLII